MTPLITNRCKKHGRAFVEDECPQCRQETHAYNINQTRSFFEQNGTKRVKLVGRYRGDGDHWVSVEDLYQYFRIRLLDEINPED